MITRRKFMEMENAASSQGDKELKVKADKVEDADGDTEIEKGKKKRKAKGVENSSKVTKKVKSLLNQVESDLVNVDFSCSKKNKKDQLPNYKIVSWNVDGLRACIKKDGLKYIEKEDADVVCLQETKCSENKLPEEVLNMQGYRKFWASSSKEGYAGVGLFSKTMPIEVQNGIGVPEYDEQGRSIMAEFRKFIVVCVYVPNAGRKLVTLDKRLEWNKLFKSYIKELEKSKPVIICGDMNVAHEEIDLKNPKSNKKNAGFTKEEREDMTDFLGSGFIDSYRHFYPNETDCYTFWSYMMKSRSKNVGWRLDYFLISERYISSICDVAIRKEVFGSDHCPIVLFICV